MSSGGIEPPACGLGNHRSVHLSYELLMKMIRGGFEPPTGGLELKLLIFVAIHDEGGT